MASGVGKRPEGGAPMADKRGSHGEVVLKIGIILSELTKKCYLYG